ncbi:MAG: helicase-related protein [Chloroflexota bacterium]|nr:helicase-related protein [Chloroflexota bacterium]
MHLPYVIDNRAHQLADVLDRLLRSDAVHALDVATAYFNVGAFDLLREALESLNSARLLLGSEPGSADDLGLRQALRRDLDAAPFDAATLQLVEALIRFLRRESVAVKLYQQGFLHAKSYLCFADQAPGDRFRPVAGIVGSSNFTRAGLTTNQELNLTHKVLLEPRDIDDWEAADAVRPVLTADAASDDLPLFAQPADASAVATTARREIKSEVGARAILELLAWYDTRWEESRDFKDDLITLLDESKFGGHEYTPYEIYLKTLYEYFRDELGGDGLPLPGTRSAVELTRFQEDAVQKARRILARYDGVLIADSVGLGKTWIGKQLLEDTAYHRRQKALVICPAALREMWRTELREAAIPAEIVSQELLGRADCELRPYRDVDVILIDESHNFRNHNTNRYENLERLIGAHGGLGRDGERKQVILLTATPINNTIFDLYNQLMLFAQGDRAYFSAAGIGDLRRYFLDARRQAERGASSETQALFNLLEEVVIRRTRAFIRKAYPEATIHGQPIHWPQRKLHTVRYNLEAAYVGIYRTVVSAIEDLTLAPYNLEQYKRAGVERDELALGREQALVGIFKSRFLKRFESSVAAFRISVRRALTFDRAFLMLLDEGQLLNSSDFRHALRYLEPEDEDKRAAPRDQVASLADNEAAQAVFEELPELNPREYDLTALRAAVQHDIAALQGVWEEIGDITSARDAKLQEIKLLLSTELRGKKVLLFTYYRDTARYLHRELKTDAEFLVNAGHPRLARLDGDVAPVDRARRVAYFAPVANDRPDLVDDKDLVDIMVSTDVLSEGQNLQDCGVLVNYDLHWNPTRMVQRAGRIDRIGSTFDRLHIYNVFPEAGLEQLLGLVERLHRKLATIDQAGMLDTSVLGEAVHPRTFNTLQRIAAEDDTVLEELEAESDLVSSEFLLATLREVLQNGTLDPSELPDGIHSGREKVDYRGLFFYFTTPAPLDGDAQGGRRHFWRYVDLVTGEIHKNRYEIAGLLRCGPDEPRVVGENVTVFAVQDRVMEHILRSVRHQQAVEAAPKIVDPLQQTVRTVLEQQRNNPTVSSQAVRAALKTLREPLSRAYVKDLRAAYEDYQRDGTLAALLAAVDALETGASQPEVKAPTAAPLTREDLHLVCWEYVWC